MPEDIFKLTDQEWSRAQNWFQIKCRRLQEDGCPSCGQNNWFIPSVYFELRTYTAGLFQAPGSVFPFFIVACANCSHSLLFNALEAGVLSDKDFKDAKQRALEILEKEKEIVKERDVGKSVPTVTRYLKNLERAGKEGSEDA